MREQVRLAIMKHFGALLEQEKEQKRDMSLISFTSSRKKGITPYGTVDSRANSAHIGCREHLLREIEHHVVLSCDGTGTF